MDNNTKMMVLICSLLITLSCLYFLQTGVCAGEAPQTIIFSLLVAIVVGYVFYHIHNRMTQTNNIGASKTNFGAVRQQMQDTLQQATLKNSSI